MVGIFGVAAIFTTSISPCFTMAADTVAAIFQVSYGIYWAVNLSDWICDAYSGVPFFRNMCYQIHALEGSMFLAFVLSLALVGLGIYEAKKRKADSKYVV